MKLSGTQQSKIAQLQAKNAALKEQIRDEEARHQYNIIQLREPVQRLVREARELGIPETQIYRTGLGMADYRTLERFMVETNGPVKAEVGETKSVEVSYPYTRDVQVVKSHPRKWDVYGVDGELWDSVTFADGDQVWITNFYQPVPDEIREALKAAAGKKWIIANFVDDDGTMREEHWDDGDTGRMS